jgi:hypothetical protein
MRLIGRTTLVAIALAGVLVAPTTATPAHAEILRERGKWCGGNEIRTCLWINVDTTNLRIRGYAWIGDAAGGGNYDVAVNEIHIQDSFNEGPWTQVLWPANPDHDGWHGVEDRASTDLWPCRDLAPAAVRYRVRALFKWSHPTTHSLDGEQWRTSYAVGEGVCNQ